VQRIIKELAKVAQVVPVNEFLSSKKCATCRNVGHDKKADYLHVCSKTRQVTCRRCGLVADRDVNAATNLVLVLLEYLLHDKRPEHLDAPYAGKY
jgi:transposase